MSKILSLAITIFGWIVVLIGVHSKEAWQVSAGALIVLNEKVSNER